MLIIDKYISKTVFLSIVLVICMLTGLQLFILFVNELGDIGKGDYGTTQALLYVLLTMPNQVYLFLPMASLLGCLIGLGILANSNELVAIRASSVSISHITLVVVKISLVLIVIVTILGEMLFPKFVLEANDNKMEAISSGQSLHTSKGVWLRYHNDFINISKVNSGKNIENVYQFSFDKNYNLKSSRHINKIIYKNNEWRAFGIEESVIGKDVVKVNYLDSVKWDVYIDPRTLNMSATEPDEMTFLELQEFLKNQKINYQNLRGYQLSYWQRLIQPLTTIVMMLLAIPFIFGPLRSSTMGSKLLIGAAVGFSFYILSRFFGSLSQIYQFSPIIAVISPTALCAFFGIYLMRKVK